MKPEKLLKLFRLKTGITQLELARRAPCSLNTVALVERGGPLSNEMAARFARVLGVTVDDLTGRATGEATQRNSLSTDQRRGGGRS